MKRFSPLAWTAALFVVSLLFENGIAVLRGPAHRSAPKAERPAMTPTLRVPQAPPPSIATAEADRGEARVQRSDSAAPPPKRTQTPRGERASVYPAAHMVIAVDPETGTLGMPERSALDLPTIEEFQAQARKEAEGLVTVHHADGSESIEHQGRFTDYAVIHIGPDGKPLFTCAHGTPGLHAALRKDLPVRSAQEDR